MYSSEEAAIKLESFCAYQERSEFEVRSKLRMWGFDRKQSDQLVEHLKLNRFLDNERFASSFVSGKFSIKKWGRLKIKSHLIQHQIHADNIKKSLEEIDDSMYCEVLRMLAEKKWDSLSKEPDSWKRKYKTMTYLQSKGYENDLIQDILKPFK
jgi:regulatory protein